MRKFSVNSTKHLLHPELQAMADAPIIKDINDDNLSVVRQILTDERPPLVEADLFKALPELLAELNKLNTIQK